MKIVETCTAQIYCGLRSQWDDNSRSFDREKVKVREILQGYCDSVGFCVSVTETEFIYTGGREPGVIVGLINYPRFPSTPHELREHAITIADRLKTEFRQKRVSIVMPGQTIMLGDDY